MHRFPENSWVGLEAALDAGACWLEFDIQMCRDGRFVLLHDDNFLRTGGVDRCVFDLDSRDIDISVHEPDRFQARHAPTPIPLLDAVLTRLSRFPAVRAMVEIKQESIDRWGLEKVMRQLLPVLQQHRQQCTLISFNEQILQWCRAHSELRIGWVLQRYDQAHRDTALALEPDFLICNQRKIGADSRPWPGNWQWMIYDISDPQTALAWAQRGVALIETADIGAMLTHSRLSDRACPHAV